MKRYAAILLSILFVFASFGNVFAGTLNDEPSRAVNDEYQLILTSPTVTLNSPSVGDNTGFMDIVIKANSHMVASAFLIEFDHDYFIVQAQYNFIGSLYRVLNAATAGSTDVIDNCIVYPMGHCGESSVAPIQQYGEEGKWYTSFQFSTKHADGYESTGGILLGGSLMRLRYTFTALPQYDTTFEMKMTCPIASCVDSTTDYAPENIQLTNPKVIVTGFGAAPEEPNEYHLTYTGETVDQKDAVVGDEFNWYLAISENASLNSADMAIEFPTEYMETIACASEDEDPHSDLRLMMNWINAYYEEQQEYPTGSAIPGFNITMNYVATGSIPGTIEGNIYDRAGINCNLNVMANNGLQFGGEFARYTYRWTDIPASYDTGVLRDDNGYYLPINIIMNYSNLFVQESPYWVVIPEEQITCVPGKVYFIPSNACTVTFTGVYNGTQAVVPGDDAILPVFDGEGLHYTFTLNGEPWDGTNVTGDITVEVGLEVNVYCVTFIDSVSGTVISEQQITHGEAASAPDAPEHIGYVFAGWDKDFSCVKSDMEINAVYDPVFVTVTYTGAYTNTQSVQYGYDAVLPVFEGEGIHYTFTVNGEPWDGTNITEDVTVFVGLDINTYTVTFIDSLTGELISEQEIRHGEPAEEPEIPEHFTYAFTGWDADFSCIKDDLTVNALYTRVECVISFYDSMTGELIADVVAPIGGPAITPTPPDHYGYSFTGWDADISCVTEDMTVNALYAPKKFAVNFTDGHGNIISSQLVTYLTAAVEPEPPYAEPGEIFIGWDADFSCITGDLTVNALWEYVTVCTVTFTGAYTGTVVVNYGEACELPVYPSQYLHYTFMVDGEYWDGECVTSDVTVVVSAAANSIDCTVIFVDWDGTVLSTQTVRYGNPATPPEEPTREGCVFTGWSKNVEFIAHDVTIKAVYAKGPDYLAGDVDCDGLVTMADVTILAMYLNGENPQISVLGMLNADANDEWKVDVRDIAAIYKIITNS